MLLSAVICTYNRRYLLEDQIKAIEAMPGWDSGDFEVIYVDNNSKDGTYEALLKLCESRPQIRVVRETHQGSSAARDRGAREALGEFVWFMDDDSIPLPSTLRVYLEALPKFNPEVATGPIIPLSALPTPWWLDIHARAFRVYLAHANYGNETRWLEGHYAWGPNFIIRKDVLVSVGGHDQTLGVVGTLLVGGEEEDLQRRIFAQGGRLLYLHEALVYHRVLPKQLRLSSFLHLRFDRGGLVARTTIRDGKPAEGLLSILPKMVGHVAATPYLLVTRRTSAAMDHVGALWGLSGYWMEKRRLSARNKRLKK